MQNSSHIFGISKQLCECVCPLCGGVFKCTLEQEYINGLDVWIKNGYYVIVCDQCNLTERG